MDSTMPMAESTRKIAILGASILASMFMLFGIQLAAQGTTFHYVTNTRPPDAFLSLRTQPSASAGQRIAIMPNGTVLEVLSKQSNGWWFVRVVPSGLQGWALSGEGGNTWIECCATSAQLSDAQRLQGFRTPSNNIHCMLNDFEPSPANPISLRCDIRETANRLPPRPRSCDLEWGTTFGITADGTKGEMWCVGDTAFDEKHPVLGYGEFWQAKGFTCRSETTGLTCFNSKMRGFSLSRAVQRVF